MTLALSSVRDANGETGGDPDLRRDDVPNRNQARQPSHVIPAKAGTHASFNKRLGAVLCGVCSTPSSLHERDVF